jgi:hypothetical protein
MAFNADKPRPAPSGLKRHPHWGSWLAGRVGRKLNDVIFIFISTYHKLREIKLFVVAGNFAGCVFDP